MPIKKIIINKKTFSSITGKNGALEFYKIPKTTYDQRKLRGWNTIDAITTPKLFEGQNRTDGVKIRINGKTFASKAAAARDLGIGYSALISRIDRGKSKKEIKHKGNLPKKSRSKIKILKDTIHNLKLFAKKNSITKKEHWYLVKLDDVANIIAYYNKKIDRKKISAFEFLKNYFPKKNFYPWLFSGKGLKMPDGTWDKKENRINYIKWLIKKLGYKSKEQYYLLQEQHFAKNHGSHLLHSNSNKSRKTYDIIDLIEESFPKYKWLFWKFKKISNNLITEKQKKSLTNKELKLREIKLKNRHKLIFNWVLKKENISINSKEIYNLNNSTFKKYKGARSLLKTYRNFPDLVIALTNKKINRFKFKHLGRGFWEDRENHKLAIQHLGKELGIKKCNDWYTVMYDDFEEAGIISVLGFQEYKGSYTKCIIKNLPKCKLNESKFDRSFKYEYRARRFAVCIYGERNVIKNHHPKFLNGLELDISIPKKNLAIEYNGKQHYIYIPHFHRNRKNFLNSLANDKKKIELSAKNNVNLIVIKYNEWDGFPKSFLNIIQNKFGLSKTERSNFWRRFKKDDLYPEVMLELKKKG